MWKQIYLAALFVAAIVMLFLTYYSYDWLQSIGSPAVAADNYAYHAAFSWAFLFISSGILLLIANVVLWTTRRSWTMWMTAGYFIVFLGIRAFWLDPAMFQFASSNNLQPSLGAVGPFLTLLLFLAVVAAVFFNHFIVLRMTDKLHPPIEPAINEPDSPADDF